MEILYHYCTPAVLKSILTTREIWASSLNQSNDTAEGRLAFDAILRLAMRAEICARDVGFMKRIFDTSFDMGVGYGFCLSEEGDLLSQWRSYGADGTGVAIGFDVDYIKSLIKMYSVDRDQNWTLAEMQYTPEAHEKVVAPTFEYIKKSLDMGTKEMKRSRADPSTWTKSLRTIESFNRTSDDTSRMAMLIATLNLNAYTLKGPGFAEEKEWRIVTSWLSGGSNQLVRATRDALIPYRMLQLAKLSCHPIRRIILGPKHNTRPHVLEWFMRDHGFGAVDVVKSALTYR